MQVNVSVHCRCQKARRHTQEAQVLQFSAQVGDRHRHSDFQVQVQGAVGVASPSSPLAQRSVPAPSPSPTAYSAADNRLACPCRSALRSWLYGEGFRGPCDEAHTIELSCACALWCSWRMQRWSSPRSSLSRLQVLGSALALSHASPHASPVGRSAAGANRLPALSGAARPCFAENPLLHIATPEQLPRRRAHV